MSKPAPSLLLIAALALLLGGAAILWQAKAGAGADEASAPSPAAVPLPAATPAALPPPGARERTELAADAPAMAAPDPDRDLHGTVTDARGTPIAGATVRVHRAAADEYGLLDRDYVRQRHEVASTHTLADGSYRVALPPGRPHQLEVTAAGFAPSRRGGAYAGSRVDVVLGPPAALAGLVLRAADRTPVVGARVRGWRRGALGARFDLFDCRTGDDGRFRCGGLEPGPCTFDVQPEDAAGPRWQEAELRAGEETVVEVVVPEGVLVRGIVVDDATSAPIAGARVCEGRVGRVVQTDSGGRFALPGFDRQADLDIEVEADGYAPVEAPVAVRGSLEVRREIEVRLRRGRRAHGRVCAHDGTALQAVYVAAAASDHDGPEQLQRTDWVSTRSDADGGFELAPLRPELRHTLFLRAEGHATMVYEFPAAEPDLADVPLGTFWLLPPGSVQGRIVDERGAPVAGHEVTLQGSNGDRFRDRPAGEGWRSVDGYVAEQEAVTDGAGRFAFTDVAAGSYALVAPKLDSHESLRRDVAVGRGEDVRGVDLVLVRGLSIAGRLLASDGSAVPVCYLSVDPEDGQETSADVEARRDGGFEARGLQPGNYRLTAYPYADERDRAAGRSFLSVASEHVPAGAGAVQITLPVAAPVRGTVLGAAGLPVAGQRLRVVASGSVVDEGESGADGSFALRGPARTLVEVQAFVPAARTDGVRVLAQAQAEPGAGEVTLTLPR